MRKRTKKGLAKTTIHNLTTDQLKAASSYRLAKEFIQSLGFYYHNRHLKLLKDRFKKAGITYPFVEYNISSENLLKKDSKHNRSVLRKHVIKNKLLDNTSCAICGHPAWWNNMPLIMILDHINGDSTDHRLENLRFVCPNCDTQLPTYAGRNSKIAKEVVLA